jgi:DNA-binding protein H-NS
MDRKAWESMSLDRLWDLHEQITQVLTDRINAEKRELNQLLQRLRGGVLRELNNEPRGVNRPRRPYPRVLPKYQNPADPSETWAGRGKMPRWLKAQVRSGRTLDDFRIRM